MPSKSLNPRQKKAIAEADETARGLANLSPAEVASYIATMTTELQRMAEREKMAFLGYLLGMCRIEAENAAGPQSP